MGNVSAKITAILLITFISLFLLLTVTGSRKEYSEQETRQPARMPKLTYASLYDGSFGRELGNYFSDRFAGRNEWISVKADIEAQMCESIVNGVYVNKSIMLDAQISDRASTSESAEAVNKFAEKYNGTLYFTVLPTSSGVYSDILPDYLITNSEKQQIDSFYSVLDSSIRKIDAYSILKAQSDNYIYYRTDTKPTVYGAYYVYRTVIQKLGFRSIEYDKYTIQHITSDFRGNLYRKSRYSGTKPDILDIYECSGGSEILSCTGYTNDGKKYSKTIPDKTFLDTDEMYGIYLGEEEPLITIKTSLNNGRKLLVIKDSYADCFIQFLIQHYSEIVIASPECMENGLSRFIDMNEYEQTLFLFGIDSLSDADNIRMINK